MERIRRMIKRMVKIDSHTEGEGEAKVTIDLFSLEGASTEDVARQKVPYMFRITKEKKNKKEVMQWFYDPLTDEIYFIDPETNSCLSLREIHNIPPVCRGS